MLCIPIASMEPIRPKTNQELKILVREAIAAHGAGCDLNHIQVSTLMNFEGVFKETPFDGDISQWNTEHMVLGISMFENCPFNGDISRWNMGNCRRTERMFAGSAFNGDISRWDVHALEDATSMFEGAPFNRDISRWDTRRLQLTDRMFASSAFNGHISNWNISAANKGSMIEMFDGSAFSGDLSGWCITSDQRGIHRLLTSDFRGIPPIPDNEKTITYYEDLFGSLENVVAYIKATPFNSVHFDLCVLASTRPDCICEEEFRWVKEYQTFGEAVGLTGAGLRTYCMERYGKVAIPETMLSVEHLNLA